MDGKHKGYILNQNKGRPNSHGITKASNTNSARNPFLEKDNYPRYNNLSSSPSAISKENSMEEDSSPRNFNTNNMNDSKNINIRMRINNINLKNTTEFFKRHMTQMKQSKEATREKSVEGHIREKVNTSYLLNKSEANVEENIGGVI